MGDKDIGIVTHQDFHVIKLWEIDAAAALATDLPASPFSHGRSRRNHSPPIMYNASARNRIANN